MPTASTASCSSFVLFAFIATFLAWPLQAQSFQQLTVDSAASTGFAPRIQPEVSLTPSSGLISVDGELDEAAWEMAERASGFTEIQPGNMEAPPVRTEAFITYDERHLYVAFVAHDPRPEQIRASMRNRDEIFQDDWVGLFLDVYGNGTEAYLILANPLGVQADLLRSGDNEDSSFDLVFESAGKVTETGYQVEMAIPFSSLRFPARDEQRWRTSFVRNHPRERRRQYSWAAISRDNPCDLCQMGYLSGIEGIQPGTNLDLMPALVGTQAATRDEPNNVQSGLDNGRMAFQPSMNMRYSFTPSFSAEATVNPDFSHVESDAAQIDVNSTFALSYPERRPFFQEGSDLFSTWIDVVYTRSVNQPMAATKLTGRMGETSVAFLSAVDEESPVLLPFQERSALVRGGRSLSNVLRLRQSMGENTFVGTTLTDRRFFGGGHGSVVSTDLQAQFWKHYRVEAQLALSDTREMDDVPVPGIDGDENFGSGYTAQLNGERYQGLGAHLRMRRSSQNILTEATYTGFSPTFRAANGFVTRNDYHSLMLYQQLRFFPNGKVVEAVYPAAFVEREVGFDGAHRGDHLQVQGQVNLAYQTRVYGNYAWRSERFRGDMYNDLYYWVVNVNSDFSEAVRGGFQMVNGRSLWRGSDPEVGRDRQLSLHATIKPMQRLVIEPRISYQQMRSLDGGEEFFSAYVGRVRTSLQVNRELSVRLVSQYETMGDRIRIEPMITYRLNPFSVFYIGTTHGYSWLDQAAEGMGIYPDLVQTERQVFFKMQYLFRI